MFVFKTCHKNQSAIEKLSGKWKIRITLRSSKVGARLSRYPRSVENGIGISVREGLNPLPLRVLASTSMALRLVSWRPLFNLALRGLLGAMGRHLYKMSQYCCLLSID